MREQGKLGWFKHDITHRGITAWLLFALLLIFYFILYFPDKIGEGAQVFGASKETVKWARGLGDSLNIFEHFMRWLGAALGFTVKKWWDPVWNKWTLYGTLYTGVTGNLVERMRRHLVAKSGFCAEYNVRQLVYFEAHERSEGAIMREKRIKRWRRVWKLELIETVNPEWENL